MGLGAKLWVSKSLAGNSINAIMTEKMGRTRTVGWMRLVWNKNYWCCFVRQNRKKILPFKDIPELRTNEVLKKIKMGDKNLKIEKSLAFYNHNPRCSPNFHAGISGFGLSRVFWASFSQRIGIFKRYYGDEFISIVSWLSLRLKSDSSKHFYIISVTLPLLWLGHY